MDYTNKGIMFPNQYKEKDSQPDMKGKLNVNGTEYRVAAWYNETDKGKNITLRVDDLSFKSNESNDTTAGVKSENENKSVKSQNLPF